MRRRLLILTAISVALAAALAAAQSRTPDPRTAAPKGVELDAIDRKTDPCTDFYQFACGAWIAKNPVPPDKRSYGRFTELQDRNFVVLRRILEAPDSDG